MRLVGLSLACARDELSSGGPLGVCPLLSQGYCVVLMYSTAALLVHEWWQSAQHGIMNLTSPQQDAAICAWLSEPSGFLLALR